MESPGLYILKSAVWLAGFTIVFLLVLRNERYFLLNRIYLLAGIIASIFFPLYTWHYAVILPSAPLEGLAFSELPQATAVIAPAIPIYYWFYLVGMVGLAVRLIGQTGIVILKLRKSGYEKSGSVKLVRTSEYAASFSFFSFVFVNPSTSDIETKEIVNHESEHIKQWHWFDLLLVEMLCMLQWFNPFVWVYARIIRQNHEYLADEKALQRTSNPAIYQATLLNQMFGGPVISLANSFSYSLNKKRFKMMKKKIDSPFRKLKLLMVLPFIAMVFYALAKPEYISSAPALPNNNINTNVDDNVVKGKVVNPDGKPIDGTIVIIKGTTIGTVTDKEGDFKLKDVTKDAELVFSFVGYQTVVVKPDFNNPMTVKMVSAAVGLDKVVVVGYGNSNGTPPPVSKVRIIITPPYRYSPESISQLENDFLKNSSDNQPLLLLDGEVINRSKMESINPDEIGCIDALKDKSATDKYGDKGKNGVIEIVSKAKMSSDNEKENTVVYGGVDQKDNPLFVINGFILPGKVLNNLDQKTIESVNVLKGVAATAKYGDQAKNGAIEVTLKKGATFVVGKEDVTSVGSGKMSDLKNPSSQLGFSINTKDSENPPLFILDGVIIDKAKMDAIDPIDIASINVLKDKSATDLYGEKAKNGVILITSKKKDTTSSDKKVDNAKKSVSNDKPVFIVVEEMPEFPGGMDALMKFVATNVRYPAEAQKKNIQGSVMVTFVVNSNGKVESAKVVRSVDPALDAEAMRVIGLLPQQPDWKPGKQRGVAVNVAYTIPIEFKLQ